MVSEASMLGLSVDDSVEDCDWPEAHEAGAKVSDEEPVWFDKHMMLSCVVGCEIIVLQLFAVLHALIELAL